MKKKFERSITGKPLSNLGKPTKKPNTTSLDKKNLTSKKKNSETL